MTLSAGIIQDQNLYTEVTNVSLNEINQYGLYEYNLTGQIQIWNSFTEPILVDFPKCGIHVDVFGSDYFINDLAINDYACVVNGSNTFEVGLTNYSFSVTSETELSPSDLSSSGLYGSEIYMDSSLPYGLSDQNEDLFSSLTRNLLIIHNFSNNGSYEFEYESTSPPPENWGQFNTTSSPLGSLYFKALPTFTLEFELVYPLTEFVFDIYAKIVNNLGTAYNYTVSQYCYTNYNGVPYGIDVENEYEEYEGATYGLCDAMFHDESLPDGVRYLNYKLRFILKANLSSIPTGHYEFHYRHPATPNRISLILEVNESNGDSLVETKYVTVINRDDPIDQKNTMTSSDQDTTKTSLLNLTLYPVAFIATISVILMDRTQRFMKRKKEN